MSPTLGESFHFLDWTEIQGAQGTSLSSAELYAKVVSWSRKARGVNPTAFDDVTAWMLDDSHWSAEKLPENEQLLMQGVLVRFIEQNTRLRQFLLELEPAGVVNKPVFAALDHFDELLHGSLASLNDPKLQETVAAVFANFAAMQDREVREYIAGMKTGPTGTDSVDVFGYINHLKNGDAHVQWALFMPVKVQEQQQGFQVQNFEYRTMPPLRFIGREGADLDQSAKAELFATLDTLGTSYRSGFDYDMLFKHHYGRGVDQEPWREVWGRLMKADTPVPAGFIHLDFIPTHDNQAGLPYISQFALATFSGCLEAMHKEEGYDVDAMYDVTRNIILGEGVLIPYPSKYWTAEVFQDGFNQPSKSYLFSVDR